MKEWTLTFPSELPFWELESQWTPKSSKGDCRGQYPSFWKVHYIIEKLLKFKCLKWAHMTHLDIWNTSYDQKKGRKSNWQFDSRPLKVANRPNFLVCMRRATYRWKALNEGNNFALDLIAIKRLQAKLWPPKVTKVLNVKIPGHPFESPRTKCHLDVVPLKSCRKYYKGEGGGFPQVRAVVSLVSPRLAVACLNTKSVQTMH